MIGRLGGVVVVLLAFGGCAFWGVSEMVTEQRVGGLPVLALILLVGPLLVVGWIAVRIGRLFIGSWQSDYFNRTLRQRRLAGLGVAVLSGGLLYAGVTFAVPSQHPGHDLAAALKLACTPGFVAGAGVVNQGAAINHLVVLAADGGEQRWTGHAPMEWKPANVADTELVACVSEQDVTTLIETCSYINGPSIKRYSATRTVKLVEPGSGRVVAEYAVTDAPRRCMTTEKREVTELIGRVEWEAVLARLSVHAGCCAPVPTSAPTNGHEPSPHWTVPPMPSPAVPVEPEVPAEPETPVP